MTKMGFPYNRLITLLLIGTLIVQACGKKGKTASNLEDRIKNSKGEIGKFNEVRAGETQYIPQSMVVVPAGTFHMGQADEDVPNTMINFNKQVTIGAFFMDETEVTNNQYRFFTDVLLAYTGSGGQTLGPEYEEGVMNPMFPNGKPDSLEIMRKMYPDTTRWSTEYAHHMGDPLMEYYFMHPAFDDYPVVGVDWVSAQFFCEWRTRHLNRYVQVEREGAAVPRFRLPTEAEWEYAAKGGRDLAKYPWGNPYVRNTLGCMLANFKPNRGNYYDDGFAYTAPVASYFSNDWGLYDMSGNVAEWCQDAYYEASVPVVWDLNPVYNPPISDRNNDPNNRRVIRGGSWKDIAYYLETGTRTFQHFDSASTSIGFRCAMTYLGRSAGNEF